MKAFSLAVLCLGPLVWGQGISTVQDRVVWDQDRVVYLRGALNPPVARILNRKGEVVRNLQMPPLLPDSLPDWNVHFVDGQFLQVVNRGPFILPKGRQFETEVLINQGSDGWKPLGKLTGERFLPSLIPLSKDRFLGVAMTQSAIVKDGKCFPFGVYLLKENGEIQLDEPMEGGLDKPVFKKEKGWNYPFLQTTFIKQETALTEDYLVLGSQWGYFWVFRRDTGRLRRLVRLYPEADEAFLSKYPPVQIVLGFQPTRAGDILIASRAKDALLEGAKEMAKPVALAMDPDTRGRTRRWADSFNATYPLVFWWNLDPEQGRITEAATPITPPKALFSQVEVLNFNWRFNPQGKVEMYSEHEKQKDLLQNPSPLSLKKVNTGARK